MKLGRHDQAIAFYQKTLEVNPKNGWVRNDAHSRGREGGGRRRRRTQDRDRDQEKASRER